MTRPTKRALLLPVSAPLLASGCGEPYRVVHGDEDSWAVDTIEHVATSLAP